MSNVELDTSELVWQVAMSPSVDGYVNGANSDFVYYRLVKKAQ